MEEHVIKGIFATGTSIAVYLWGGWDDILIAMVVIVILDYITGLLKAGYERELNSKVGAKGILKKLGYMSAIALAHIVDNIAGVNGLLRNACIFFFIMNEGLSILENLAAMGIIVPEKVKDMLEQLKDRKK